ncbi:ATPase [Candidatus Formimonas warabiya]|nr:ATPase [Candidatus Formimonas warabiya]
MDVMKLMDEMETIIDSGSRIPLLGKVLIDAEALLEYMDRIRASLPEEIKQAKFVNMEREKVLQDAQRRADKMLEEAENQARKIISEDQIMKQAQIEAEELLQQARKTSNEIKQGARVYANDMLHQLEINLEKALYTIKKGREELQGHQQRTSA